MHAIIYIESLMEHHSLLYQIKSKLNTAGKMDYTYAYSIYELKKCLGNQNVDLLIAPAGVSKLHRILELIKQHTIRLIIIDADPDTRELSIFSKGLCASMHQAIPFELKTYS